MKVMLYDLYFFFATFNFSVITTFRFRLYMLMDVQTSFDRNAVNSVRETEKRIGGISLTK